jgi:hypothetical protein
MVEVAFGEGERFLDPESGSPQDRDQSPEAQAVRSIAGGAHDGHNLFDLRRIGGVAQGRY